MVAVIAPGWLPNWKNPKAYPEPLPPHKVTKMTRRQWRWEFIRRMDDYQAAWETRDTQSVAAVLERYGMTLMIDPSIEIVTDKAIVPRPTALTKFPFDASEQTTLADDGYAIFAIDVTATKEQISDSVWRLAAAYQHLNSIGPKGRNHSSLMPRYLRILDGAASGASFSEVADELSTGSETVSEELIRKQYGQAKELAARLAK